MARESARLLRLLGTEEETYRLSERLTDAARVEANQRNAEAWVDLRQFPLDEHGRPYAAFPTRLGNLITAYESYADTRYGVDTIFWWPRIWLMLDKDTREELDTRQASADSGLYAAGALAVDALLWTLYLLLRLSDPGRTRWPALAGGVATLQKGLNAHLPGSWGVTAAVIALFILGARIAYVVALSPQAQYGETFKAVFDLNHDRIDVSGVVERIVAVSGDFGLRGAGRRAQLKAAWRYLHDYRARCPDPGCTAAGSVPVPQLEAHRGTHAGGGPALPSASAATLDATVPLATLRGRVRSATTAVAWACTALLALGHFADRRFYLFAPIAAGALWISAWNLRRARSAPAAALTASEAADQVRQVTWTAEFLRPWLPELAFPFLFFLAIGALLYIIDR